MGLEPDLAKVQQWKPNAVTGSLFSRQEFQLEK
jgi:hypothetical protein